MKSRRNICTASDKMKTPSNLQNFLVCVEKDIKEINKNIGVLDKMNLTLSKSKSRSTDTFFI